MCLKPWKYSVVYDNAKSLDLEKPVDTLELIFRIECRGLDGERINENDLEVEIYLSGNELNLILAYINPEIV